MKWAGAMHLGLFLQGIFGSTKSSVDIELERDRRGDITSIGQGVPYSNRCPEFVGDRDRSMREGSRMSDQQGVCMLYCEHDSSCRIRGRVIAQVIGFCKESTRWVDYCTSNA